MMERKYYSIVLCIIISIMLVGCNQDEDNLQQETGSQIIVDEEGNLDAIQVVLDDADDVSFDLENGVLLKIGENQYNMIHPSVNELIGKMVSDGVMVTDLYLGKIDSTENGYIFTENGAKLWQPMSLYNSAFEAAENVVTKYMNVTCFISEEADAGISADCFHIRTEYADFETMDGITQDSTPDDVYAVCGGYKGTVYVDGQKVDISVYKDEAEEFMALYEENPQIERPDILNESVNMGVGNEYHVMFMFAQDKAIGQYRKGEIESICVIQYGLLSTAEGEMELGYVEYYILGPEYDVIYEEIEESDFYMEE